jgi:hypothetical protein
MEKLALILTTIAMGGTALLAISGNGSVGRLVLGSEPDYAHGSHALRTIVQHESADHTLWGIFGRHDVEHCPLHQHSASAQALDHNVLLREYGISRIHDRYHAGVEHRFLWVIETTRPHELERFAIDHGIAGHSELTIVPITSYGAGVAAE